MMVFGPKYPQPLQAVIDHGERLCVLVARLEDRHPDPRRWLVGRREEIELVLRLRVRDWRARRIGLEYAAKAIGAYLDDLHTGATQSLGLAANIPLVCCTADPSIPVSLAPGQRAPSLVATAETWFDLHALLDLDVACESGDGRHPERNLRVDRNGRPDS
jgi:hypothetical protein